MLQKNFRTKTEWRVIASSDSELLNMSSLQRILDMQLLEEIVFWEHTTSKSMWVPNCGLFFAQTVVTCESMDHVTLACSQVCGQRWEPHTKWRRDYKMHCKHQYFSKGVDSCELGLQRSKSTELKS